MSSEKQIAANGVNARKSTGPRTPEGKTKVSINAVKHGLTARDLILPGENPDDLDLFYADFLTALAPQGPIENFLAEKIASDAWRILRVPVFEAGLHGPRSV